MKTPCFLAFTIASACLSATTISAEIEVFTASYIQPVKYPGHHISYYALDAPDRINDRLPEFSAVSEKQAYEAAMAWLKRHGTKIADALKTSTRGRTRALEYQVTKVPAIVFDQGSYVVYGTADVNRALSIYQAEKNQ